MIELREFAAKHGLRVIGERKALKVALQPDGKPHPDRDHIPGKRGWITEAGTAFDVFILRGQHPTALIEEAKQLGLEIAAHGDKEIGLHFDPEKPAQVQFAVRAIGARKKRKVTDTQREAGKRLAALHRMPIAA